MTVSAIGEVKKISKTPLSWMTDEYLFIAYE